MSLEREKVIRIEMLIFLREELGLFQSSESLAKESTNENYGCSVSGLDLWVFRKRFGMKVKVRKGFLV